MNNYETMFIVKSDLASEEKDKLLKQLESDIAKQQGKIEVSKVWAEKRSLCFKINKCSEGMYYLIQFSSAPDAISKLKQIWNINDNILRFLILKK